MKQFLRCPPGKATDGGSSREFTVQTLRSQGRARALYPILPTNVPPATTFCHNKTLYFIERFPEDTWGDPSLYKQVSCPRDKAFLWSPQEIAGFHAGATLSYNQTHCVLSVRCKISSVLPILQLGFRWTPKPNPKANQALAFQEGSGPLPEGNGWAGR